MNDIATQYRIIEAGAGWAEKVSRGRLRFDGADRRRFLHDLLTNDIAALGPRQGTYALYLTPQGRLITDMHVFARTDSLLMDVPAGMASALADAFDKLIFAEDARVSDQSASIRQFTVVGGRAAEVIAAALGLPATAVRDLPTWAQVDAGSGFVARTDDAGEGSWDVLVAATEAGAVVAALESAGAVPASASLLEALRIDAGRPLFGVDMDPTTIPLEAGLLDRAISQTKGCYVGQEVIARVLHRGGGRVARRLVQMVCDAADAPVPLVGAAVTAGDAEIGRVTSAAWSPRIGRGVALGYVSRETADAGGALMLSWPDGRASCTFRVV
jgi:tRNA-modifying protein YgfZ